MRKTNIALGFYQNFAIANGVLKELREQGYRRIAYLHRDSNGKVSARRFFPYSLFLSLLSFLALSIVLFFGLNFFGLVATPWLLTTFAGLLLILGVVWLFRTKVDPKLVKQSQHLLVRDEILVIVEVNGVDVRRVLDILRHVETGHPLSFLLRSEVFAEEDKHFDLVREPMTVEQLRNHAMNLAESLPAVKKKTTHDQPLLQRLKSNKKMLQFLRHDVAQAEHIEQTITPSAEWLLDNMYVIEGSIEEVLKNLPKEYYRKLPKISEGPLKGLPRIYVVAVELVNGTAGRLTNERIVEFLNSFQTVQPLTIGELWALPLMLRLRLVEWIQKLAMLVDERMREGELASFWGNRLLSAARQEPERLPAFLKELKKAQSTPSFHFAEELLDHLFDEEAVLVHVRTWLEEYFGVPLADVIHEEQTLEAGEQVVFSNSIISLIVLSQLSWREIFESVSLVDAILREDPLGVYAQMDFVTRNRYREVVEQLSTYSKVSERDVAQRALSFAQQGHQEFEQHIGYYLIDGGKSQLEKNIAADLPWYLKLRKKIVNNAMTIYLGGIGALVVGLEILLVSLLWHFGLGSIGIGVFAFLALLPISELAVQAINILLTRLLPPSVLPKMSYEEGIPAEYKTLVVVPMMLGSVEAIEEELYRLEIRYLANTDPTLCFALFSDFLDASEQQNESDELLLKTAVEGMQALENKYGTGRFFLLHRQRKWSDCEQAWIGWERKRGKLECLNRALMGEESENIIYAGKREQLQGIRYVITLDSDTQLPKDTARQMIEVISHPLNKVYVSADSKRVIRGYTIIQPRVCTDFLKAKSTWFSRIFSEPMALDPYTQAISNVYQDLTGEGSYHGKGIYDLKPFHDVLSGRFPEKHLLSHDLLEGAYVRVGFASNVSLFDQFPEDYFSWSNRQHRWIRGDFQIVDWLLPYVPFGEKGRERNPLPVISLWKIFDNLRRALMNVALVALLLAAWTTIMPAALLLTSLAVVVLFLPCVVLIITTLFDCSFQTLSFREILFGWIRAFVTTAMLPYEAFVTLDAAGRVAYRRLISSRNLLQWITAGYGNRSSPALHERFLRKLGWSTLFAVAVVAGVVIWNPGVLALALPFGALWALSPLIIHLIDRSAITHADTKLNEDDRKFLRRLARQTWRYFDDFVGPESHWLPPDNYQTGLKIEVAQRTSPTNMGLWLLAVLDAYDFRYISCDDVIDKLAVTVENFNKLERYEGHFLNWYDTATLNPLYPRYISTVDSGNFIACCWTLKQGLEDVLTRPVFPENAFAGIEDTLGVLEERSDKDDVKQFATQLRNILKKSTSELTERIAQLRQMEKIVRGYLSKENGDSSSLYWAKEIQKHCDTWSNIIERYFSWVETSAIQHDMNPSLQMLADGELTETLKGSLEHNQLREALAKAQWLAGEKIGELRKIAAALDGYSDEINLEFLYNKQRKLFAIGYNIDDRRLDNSYYDLLASEARIASVIAIAKGDVPIEHWWSLGRGYTIINGHRALLSWGGTMFEYLMPLIFNRFDGESLLGNACRTAVTCQIEYGNKRGIPWGISEAAFSAIDAHKTYQYKSFGVPGLGLKRNLEEDLIVSPYSSALALMVNAPAALKNLRRMANRNHDDMLGSYGYFESIDFLRQRSPGGIRGVIVYAYMAHHQGMTLAALNNVLNEDVLSKRFHSDPRIRGVESLLYERIPISPIVKVSGHRKENVMTRLKPFVTTPIMGVVDTPQSSTPKINLLSNGNYHLMVTNSGGGYSRWRDIEITRWRSDTTRDCYGSFCYVKDMENGTVWSTAFHPTEAPYKHYSVNFKADKAEFRRKDHGIEIFTEIAVSPEDNAEVRMLTFINHSNKTRTLELTSYLELSMAPHAADRAHPCFNKFFIETEAVPEFSALLAFRRMRAEDEAPLWAGHVMTTGQLEETGLQYETDRERFIGRGRSMQRPAAVDRTLSNTVGTVLDPIFSIRKTVVLEPGKRTRISYITAVATSREAMVSLLERYREIGASHRALELAWNYAQLELRHLRIHQEDVQLFRKLASRIIYPHSQLRSSEERLKSNKLGQAGLWAQGISGDLPILVVSVGDMYDADLVKQVLIAHQFWALRGLQVDLVILNDESDTYEHPLQEQLKRMLEAYAHRGQLDVPGGVFLRSSTQMPAEELNLLLSVASAVLVAARGSLRQQLVSPMSDRNYPNRLIVDKKVKDVPSQPLPFLELPYFNGVGGYSLDGREYVIYLGTDKNTPAPWINVIANEKFGTLVTETGMGCTWYGNSQTNRLTPWSNDPVLNPISDAIYIRDEETGTVWSPTPAPIRENDAYRISHGQGYTRFEHNSHGIEQELTVFVPNNDAGGLPLRIQRLRLKNGSARSRRLTVTAYSDWVLGSDREVTQLHVITEWDPESQALLAYNRYHPNFGSCVAFASSLTHAMSFTADRAEFIGRNSSTSNPFAMKRKALSGRVGAALDPCAAIQVMVDINPGEVSEVVFVLGYAQDAAEVRQLMSHCRAAGKTDQLLDETKAWWDKVLGAVQVEVPDLAINFSMNRWLVYQNLSCRIWGRTAFYQSSGAYGFRDQLQDVMGLLYTLPKLARAYILYAATRQFVEGDVQHWWHAQSGGGIRTRISDDLLWLPFVTAQYVRVTGDTSILEEQVSFLEAPLLTEEQHEVYDVPAVAAETATLLEHCRRAVLKGLTAGPHGLPLMGGGDWNDGMNRVGIQGKGESVWLAWFLIHVLHDFADLLGITGDTAAGEGLRVQAKRLAETVEHSAWDGEWYRRAYFDDGSPLGSKESEEAKIDSLAQSWAVISGLGNPERVERALASAYQYLFDKERQFVKLLTPPFDKTEHDPGYIKGYPPGVRENGGQYTHGSLWLAMAYARRGDGTKAVELLKAMHPAVHTYNEEISWLYRVEPYVIVADIYDLAGQQGRGGWSWYTGSAGWMYRIWLEEVLGIKVSANELRIESCLPKEWNEVKVKYNYQTSTYHVVIRREDERSEGKTIIRLDGVLLEDGVVRLESDGREHHVEVVLT
ncbi:MAG: protein ndvB [Parachlamydiaceae bacterium]|nr:protein ndvB [Parachlamydiaceae bacterium]